MESLLKRLGSSSGVTLKNRGKKNDALAQRVAAMKLKSTASGQESLPQEERIYFYLTFLPNQLSYDQEHKAFTDKPIFLCKEWTVGKCIDWIATHFTLINRNNEPKQSKLVLTSEQLLQTAQEDCPEESAQCCDKRNGHLCFSHELKDLESRKVIGNTDKLLISYFKL